MRAPLALASLVFVPACTLATASPGFEEYGGPLRCGDSGPTRDLVVNLTAFSAHARNTITGDLVRIETDSSRTLVGRFVFDPGRTSDISLVMPCALGSGQYELDLLADIDDDGLRSCPPLGTDPPPECIDHQWRLEIQGDGSLNYMHDLRFENLAEDPGVPEDGALPLDVTLQNFGDYEGLPLEVHVRRIVDTEAGYETVYVHRLAALPPVESVPGGALLLPRAGTIAAPAVSLALPETLYEAVFWIDVNQNGTYEVPSATDGTSRDVSWRTEANFDVGGVHAILDASAPGLALVDARL